MSPTKKELVDSLAETIKLGRTPLFMIQAICAYYAVAIIGFAPQMVIDSRTRAQGENTIERFRTLESIQDASNDSVANWARSNPSSSGLAGYGLYGGGFGSRSGYSSSWAGEFAGVKSFTSQSGGFGGFGFGGDAVKLDKVETELVEVDSADSLVVQLEAYARSAVSENSIILTDDGDMNDVYTRHVHVLHAGIWMVSQEAAFIESIEKAFDAKVELTRERLLKEAQSEPKPREFQEAPYNTQMSFGKDTGGVFNVASQFQVGIGEQTENKQTQSDIEDPEDTQGKLTWETASARQKLFWLNKISKPTSLSELHRVSISSLSEDQIEYARENLESLSANLGWGNSELVSKIIRDAEKETNVVSDFELPVVGSTVPVDFGLALAGPILAAVYHFWILCFFRTRLLEVKVQQIDGAALEPVWSTRLFTQQEFSPRIRALNSVFGFCMFFVVPCLIPLMIGVVLFQIWFWGGLVNVACAGVIGWDTQVVWSTFQRLGLGENLIARNVEPVHEEEAEKNPSRDSS